MATIIEVRDLTSGDVNDFHDSTPATDDYQAAIDAEQIQGVGQ